METKHFFHYATKGLEDDVLFGSRKSFIAGMNRIGLCLIKARESSPILIFSFCLMDNHVHFILYGFKENCDSFMALYKRLTEIWLAKHPEEGAPGKKWEIGHWIIKDEESLIEKIVYVHRNPVAARMPYVPGGYEWSSARLMFSSNEGVLSYGTKVSNISLNKQRILFGSKISVPGDWIVLPDGMIWPGCYTDYKRAERYFTSVVNYQFELNRHCEDAVNREMLDDHVSLPDNDIKEAARVVSKEMFNTECISSLDLDKRLRLAKELRKRTGSSTKQISRIVRIRLSDLRELI